jgi:hypothetical protein
MVDTLETIKSGKQIFKYVFWNVWNILLLGFSFLGFMSFVLWINKLVGSHAALLVITLGRVCIYGVVICFLLWFGFHFIEKAIISGRKRREEMKKEYFDNLKKVLKEVKSGRRK